MAFFFSAGLLTTQVRWPCDWPPGSLRLSVLEPEATPRPSCCSSSQGRPSPSQATVRFSGAPGLPHSRLTLHQPDVLDRERIRIWGCRMGSGVEGTKEKLSVRMGGYSSASPTPNHARTPREAPKCRPGEGPKGSDVQPGWMPEAPPGSVTSG